MGDVKAKRMLESCNTLEEFQYVVQDEYQKYYKDGWREALEFNGMLIHIQTSIDDVFSVDDWV